MLIIIGLGMLFMLNPIDYVWMPRCLFKMVTGLNCPGCGLLRAAHAALHGRLAEAVAYNYWLLLTLPYLFAVIVQLLLPQCPLKALLRRLTGHRFVIGFYIVTFLAWFIIRNIYGI